MYEGMAVILVMGSLLGDCLCKRCRYREIKFARDIEI